MVNARLNDPEGHNRASTIAGPWDKFQEGDPGPLLDNMHLLLTMPITSGDPEWRYNVAGRPLFLLPIGLLVYAGFGLLLWRARRQPMNVALIALALVGLVPSLLTNNAPSYLRSIITLPSIMIFIAVAIDWLRRFRSGVLVWGVALAVITATLVADWDAYFNVWPHSDQVHTIYRDDLEQLANFLREETTRRWRWSQPTSQLFLTPAIFSYLNAPADADVVFFDGNVAVALSHEPTLLFISPDAPITPAHWEWLTEGAGTVWLDPLLRQDGTTAYEVYRLAWLWDGLATRLDELSDYPVYFRPPGDDVSEDISAWGTRLDYPVNIGNVLQLVGVEMPQTEIPQRG